ncbi:thiamine pyrophosphate carrier protein-like [Hyalella azteca]|uniref:Mitochondrial thiamine pyrophosphate carrier n=1 Tax=Hyalella azteca TaxID=294128 RepID=A0A6A0GWP1_HYAAZ|nr:mitochondrial thiamine pyrophosphate carrier [Hyalella azteca]KAA0189112.1 thiamine pyrophosphate carrier protein-like [Hyalella azteca]
MSSNVGYNSSSANLSASEIAAAGAVSGFVTRMLAQPLDVLKIRFQLQVEPTTRGGGGHYTGLLQAGARIVREEGARALWKGHVAAQVLTVLYGAGQFWSYYSLTKYITVLSTTGTKQLPIIPSTSRSNTCEVEVTHDISDGSDKNLSNATRRSSSGEELSNRTLSLCGSMSALCGTLLSMPCDVARTRIVAQSTKKYSGLLDVLWQMPRQEGLRSLWRGLLPTLASSVPSSAIQFPIYTSLMRYTQGHDSALNVAWRSSLCGSVAGLAAKLLVYPLDLLKKRSQMRGAENLRHTYGKVISYRNTLDICRSIWREEGLRGWYKGLWPALVKSAVVSAVSFTAFEMCCRALLFTHSHWKIRDNYDKIIKDNKE